MPDPKNTSYTDLSENERVVVASLLEKLNDETSDAKIGAGIARKLYEIMRDNETLSRYNFPKRKSTDGFYHIQVKDPSKPSGRRQIKASSIEKLQAAVLKHERSVFGQSRKTFHDVYVITQKEQLRYVKDPNKKLSVMNSVTRHYQSYDRFFTGTEFEHRFIDEITENDIQQICLMNLERYDLRQRALDSMRAILSVTFRKAYKERWIDENVFLRVDFSDSQIQNMVLSDVEIEDCAHSDEELSEMFFSCKEKLLHRPSLFTADALMFQILTGLRRGEICPLKWSDIKISKRGTPFIEISSEMIEVKKSSINPKSFCTIVPHTKTDRKRRIPIWDELQELLDELQEAHDKYFPDSPFIFPANNGIGCLNLHTVYNFYYRLCEKLNIPLCREEIKGTHSFRRNFAERVDDEEMASKLLGNDRRVLRKNYYNGLNLENAQYKLAEHRFSCKV